MKLLIEYLSSRIDAKYVKEGFPYSNDVNAYKEFLKNNDFEEIKNLGEPWYNLLYGMNKKTNSHCKSFYNVKVAENDYIAFVQKGDKIDDEHPMFVYNVTQEKGYSVWWKDTWSKFKDSIDYDSFEQFKKVVDKYFGWK